MSEVNIGQEDLRALHNEIIQTLNQRFLSTTAAVALFGVVTGIAAQQTPNERMVLLLSALLIVGLFVLYVQVHFLRRATYTLAGYIHLRGWSEYTVDFAAYREEIRQGPLYTAYQNAQTITFVALTVLAAILPFMISYANERPITSLTEAYIVAVSGFVSVFAICGMGFSRWFVDRGMIDEKWRRALRASGRLK